MTGPFIATVVIGSVCLYLLILSARASWLIRRENRARAQLARETLAHARERREWERHWEARLLEGTR